MCMLFLEALEDGINRQDARISDILDHVDIWVIPLVNPDGRDMDDQDGGNPEEFWTTSGIGQEDWHPSTTNDNTGWRPNAQPVSCSGFGFDYDMGLGIDVNRAFSTDWWNETCGRCSEHFDCGDNKYHGEFPFQAEEASVLRRFVNNHMISMSLSVHSYDSTVGAQTGDSRVLDNFMDAWNNAAPPALELLARNGGGSGVGQFTAWLSQPTMGHCVGGDRASKECDPDVAVSDPTYGCPGTPNGACVTGPDQGTARGVVALLLELPPDCNSSGCADDPSDPNDPYDYKTSADYRWDPSDTSNAFHPSAQQFLDDLFVPFLEGVLYLAEQARSPWCALDPTTLQPEIGCQEDFGLTGSKIATCIHCPGGLWYERTRDESIEILIGWDREVVYRIYNFTPPEVSTHWGVQVTVEISSRPFGGTIFTQDLTETQSFFLPPQRGGVVSVPFTFVAPREYIVAIEAHPVFASDANPDNNRHVFRFRVPLIIFDSDGNFLVDWNDLAAMLTCYGGPSALSDPGCEVFRADDDLDVDLFDFSYFQAAFTGSQ